MTGRVADGCASHVRLLVPMAGLAVPIAAVLAVLIWRHVAAARARAARRNACPFEDDDDARRPLAREVRDLIAEAVALGRLLVASTVGVPATWRALERLPPATRRVIVLLPARGLGGGSLAPLGRRLARALDAHVLVEPPGVSPRQSAVRAERLVDLVEAVRARAPGAAVTLVGHGAGGRAIGDALALGRLPVAAAVALAADWHGVAGTAPSPGPELIAIHSVHDAWIVPPSHAYVSGAVNVALHDVGHFALPLSPRTVELVVEQLPDVPVPTRGTRVS